MAGRGGGGGREGTRGKEAVDGERVEGLRVCVCVAEVEVWRDGGWAGGTEEERRGEKGR